jgi:hypothetical protein
VETGWCKVRRYSLLGKLYIVNNSPQLRLAGYSPAVRQPLVIHPGHPLQRFQLDRLAHRPGRMAMYQLSLVQIVDGFGEHVIIAAALAARGWFNAGLDQALAVADRPYRQELLP